MTFTSFEYYLFLPFVFLVYQVVGEWGRRWWLLLMSYVLYGSLRTLYLPLVLAGVTVLTYFCGLAMGRKGGEGRTRLILWFGIGGNIIVLVVMKYLSFLMENLSRLGSMLGTAVQVHIPQVIISIGVSFVVLQAIGYLLDISLELAEPERNFGVFALSLAFFPKLLQGPIERNRELIPNLKTSYSFDYENIRTGLLMVAAGLFKKVVLADRLARYVNLVYDDVQDFSGLVLVMTTYIYALQLYFDFSGYTDMALGTARLFNIPLTQNFNNPYLATSVADFWRRWHISFSRWILDYIFKPLQMHWRDWGNRGTALAIFFTFLLSGIWHGASWTFIIWGLLHGIYLAASVIWQPYRKKVYLWLGVRKGKLLKAWQILVTFNLVCFSWIFFRAKSLDDAWYVVTHLFHGIALTRTVLLDHGERELSITILFLVLFLGIMQIKRKHDLTVLVLTRPLWVRWLIYWGFFYSIILYGAFDSSRSFVYFQF